MSITRAVLRLFVLSLPIAACTEHPTGSVPVGPVHLTLVSGDAQTGSTGQELPQPLVVRIVGTNGKGIRGQIVNFRVTAGGGRMYAGASLTDANGLAQDYWTLGTPGPQQVEVVAVEPTTGAKQNFGSFTATALAPAALSITPPTTNVGTWLVGATSGNVVFTVQNTGGEPSGAPSSSLGGVHANDFAIVGTTCVAPLAAGATCTVTARFAPQGSGVRTASLTVSASPGGSATATLTGTGQLGATLTVTPPTQNFGSLLVGGTSASQTFTVQNTGGVPATGLGASLGGTNPGDFQFSGNTCTGVTLNPGQTCLIGIFFRPTAGGSRAATLNVSASGGVTGSAALSGTGVVPPTLSISPSLHNYGSVAVGSAGTPQSFTVTNTGGSITNPVTISVTGANGSDFPNALNTCNGLSLTPGQTCTILVNFVPQASGARTATLQASAASAVNGSAALSGTGTLAGAQLSLTPASRNFGTVFIGGSPASFLFTIANIGQTTTGQITVSITGVNAAQFSISGDSCSGTTLTAASTCTLTVQLDPSITGTLAASLSATASPGGTVVSSLTGTGAVQAQLTVSPTSLTFGNQAVRTNSVSQRITISNIGVASTPLAIQLTGASPLDYQTSGSCGSSLAPGASCFVDVVFSPVSIGARNAILAITAPGFSSNVSLTGTGI